MATYEQLRNLETATLNLLEAIGAGKTRLSDEIEAVDEALGKCPNFVVNISEVE